MNPKSFNLDSKLMKTKLFLLTNIPLWSLATWTCFKQPEVKTVYEEKLVYPDNVDACVSLTKFQLEKMLSVFNQDDHASEMMRFNSLVKRDGDGWRISSTHLAKGAEKYPLPEGRFFVVDSSYVDHSGDFKSCVEYAESYKSFHDYIVISAE